MPIRPLQLHADGGYQLRIRRLEGTPNYGPRQARTDKNKNDVALATDEIDAILKSRKAKMFKIYIRFIHRLRT
jgi:hypothetical protein